MRSKTFLKNYIFTFSLIFNILIGLTAAQHSAMAHHEIYKERLYGLPDGRYDTIKNTVKNNESLSVILQSHHVPYSLITDLVAKARKVFDVQKIKTGNTYLILRSPDSDSVQYFLYEQDPIHFVIFDLIKSDVYIREKTTSVQIIELSGVIKSSLWQTLSELKIDNDLVAKLSDLYAGSIDFSRLQKGDRFRIILEQEQVSGKPVGFSRIIAAQFTHKVSDYYVFLYENQGRSGYYDENGVSIHKAFLRTPLKFTRITSRPGPDRIHPILGIRRAHLGTDYAALIGTPVHTIGDGIVLEASTHPDLGNYIAIRHKGIYKSEYLHLSKINAGIKPGKRVSRGDVIGYVGQTGLATGPHLCFRFWKNGKTYNHNSVNLPLDKEMKIDDVALFRKQIELMKERLHAIDFTEPQKETSHLAKN